MKKVITTYRIAITAIIAIAFLGVGWLVLGQSLLQAGPSVDSNEAYAEAQNLIGTWGRGFGTFTLVIEDVRADGSVQAHYLNPDGAHIKRANWTIEKNRASLNVQLHDNNYPGSTYTLTYDAPSDLLKGTCYQARVKQRYDVQFNRVSSEL
jgi:hypothetical protein